MNRLFSSIGRWRRSIFFMKNINILLDEFMIYCESKNLSKKTMMSYEQTLKLFFKYLHEKENIMDASKVSEKLIREYINYIKERGKYTVVSNKNSLKTNTPEVRTHYGKKVSITIINNYIRNIKVFFELLRHIDTTKFHEYRDYICIQLILDTGMRISECLAIQGQIHRK